MQRQSRLNALRTCSARTSTAWRGSTRFQITFGTWRTCLQHRHHHGAGKSEDVCLRSYPTRGPHTACGRGIPEKSDHNRPRFAYRQAPGYATAGGVFGCVSGLVDQRGQQPSPDSSAGTGSVDRIELLAATGSPRGLTSGMEPTSFPSRFGQSTVRSEPDSTSYFFPTCARIPALRPTVFGPKLTLP